MMTCQYCGAKNPVGTAFCDACGSALSGAVAAQASAQAQAQAAQATAQYQALKISQQAAPQHGTGRLPPRTMLGRRYIVLKTVGQGGMAAVYQATDTKSNRVVAIKEMSQDGLTPEELREALDNFSAEARMLQNLNHDNLPKVYESFTESARHYLVMEFIEGQTLEQKMRAVGGALPQADVLRWSAQLCAALDYLHLHKPPIIFRDLKPANIMVTPKGKIKLIDFGIARIFNRSRTKDTQALGTPGYAPPEQYGSAQTDPRADIYALGATLYQLLTGYDVSKTPFALPPIQSKNPMVAPNVRYAIERATRLDRNQRYQSVREFQTDLLNPPGLYLLSGALARSPEDLLRLMAVQSADGIDALYSGSAADWLVRWKRRDLATAATRAVSANSADRAAGLRSFLAPPNAGANASKSAQPNVGAGAKWPGAAAGTTRGAPGRSAMGAKPGQAGANGNSNSQWVPVAIAAATALGAGVSAALAQRGAKGAAVAGQASRAPASPLHAGMNAAVTSFASALVGTVALPAVSPRELDLGPVTAGRDIIGTLNLSAQPSVTGVIKPLKPWIKVSAQQFSGQHTTINVTAHADIGLRGPQQGNIQITVPGRSMFVPVNIDIVQPMASPPAPRAPQVAPTASATATGAAAAVKPGRSARTARSRLQNSLAAGGAGAVRFVLSVVAALALAIGAPLGLSIALGKWIDTPNLLPSFVSPSAALVAIGAVLALGGALLAYIGGRRAPGRGRTAALGGLIGLIVALDSASLFGGIAHASWGQTLFPAASAMSSAAPLGIAIPLLVAIGAALGAQAMISRGLMALARLIGAHSVALLGISAIVGGWLGITLVSTLWTFQNGWAVVASMCGLIAGAGLGLLISSPLGMAARRFAAVRP
jgi:serine/threonine protein kinase